MPSTDVLVIGAGPTGLVLALWLDAQGVAVRIVDKSKGPGETSRALAVHARTLELYRQLGLGDAVAQAGHRGAAFNMWVAGKRRARIPFGSFGGAITPYPFVLIYPQDHHERFLVERLAERGIAVERETELVGFEDRGTEVVARLRRPGGGEESCEARFLAGCDGARSTVRHLLGASFEGGTYDQLFYVADVDVANDTLGGEIHIAFEGPEFVLIMPYGQPGKLRVVGTVREARAGAAEPLSFDDVEHRSIHALGLEVERVNWFSTYRVHHRVTERFRHGNAFLLGDAAHVHSPAGGQGMNTGIGDAINLAWKLAAVLKNEAEDSLLDSFEAERPVFARKLVETTDRVFTFATARGSVAEFVRTHVAPGLARFAWGLRPVREAMFRLVSQTMLRYPESPLSVGKAGKVSGGDRLPFVRFDGRDNYGPLSDIRWQVHVYGTATRELQQWCSRRGIPLHEFPWREAFGEAGLARDAAYLLRPDTYVGLAEPGGRAEALESYLAGHGLRPKRV
ncbi:FAD-dependent monooxygenase [Sabulicella glaciei]|uniref:FAD-dependent monooxygenase n=1 Tax=Sabulicella glaciei TaxID=2984948 RepID=A0ABT3NTR0_9PROT|nr:FAD-dependent monooxygenase [Roseococcus sp. MDT2-1-1]MCW8085534.1 FAD-dependent monooxygenase [Roseococcus sp. MDT2-1-1]